jgi:hypothetical protein
LEQSIGQTNDAFAHRQHRLAVYRYRSARPPVTRGLGGTHHLAQRTSQLATRPLVYKLRSPQTVSWGPVRSASSRKLVIQRPAVQPHPDTYTGARRCSPQFGRAALEQFDSLIVGHRPLTWIDRTNVSADT